MFQHTKNSLDNYKKLIINFPTSGYEGFILYQWTVLMNYLSVERCYFLIKYCLHFDASSTKNVFLLLYLFCSKLWCVFSARQLTKLLSFNILSDKRTLPLQKSLPYWRRKIRLLLFLSSWAYLCVCFKKRFFFFRKANTFAMTKSVYWIGY